MGKVAERFPFLFLVGLAEDLNWPADALEAGGELGVAGDRPDANRLGGAGVKKGKALGRLAESDARSRMANGKAERAAEGFPLDGARCVGMDFGEWFGEEKLASQAGKANATGRAGKSKDEMIAGIAAGGGGNVGFLLADLPQDCPERSPRPAAQPIFAGKLCPRGDERKDGDLRPKFFGEFGGVGFGEQDDAKTAAGGLKEGGADGQIADAPKFGDEQGFHEADF